MTAGETPGTRAGAAEESTGDSLRPRRERKVAKLSEIVAHEILENLVDDQLGPGDRLPPESKMLEQYQVGRSSLREAVRVLEVYGLLTIRSGPSGGPSINELGPRDLARVLTFFFSVAGMTYGDLLDATRLLQVALAARAAELQDPAQVRRIRAAQEEARAADDEVTFGHAMHNFHKAVIEVPDSGLLSMLRDVLQEVLIHRMRRGSSVGEARDGVVHHDAIADAIASGDSRAAGDLMDEHQRGLAKLYNRSFPRLSSERIVWT